MKGIAMAMKLAEPFRRQRNLLTLSVEYGAVKLLLTHGTQVLDYRLLPVNPAFFREGLIGRPTRVAQAVTSALQDLWVDYGRIIAAVPGYESNLRLVELPRGRGLDPQVALPREASRLMGIGLDRALLRWQPLPDWQDQRRWVVVSVTRRSVDTLLETIRNAGLQLNALESRPFALARCVNQRDAIIAWLTVDGSDVVVVRDSIPVFYSSSTWEPVAIDEGPMVERTTQMVEQALRAMEMVLPSGSLAEDVPLCVVGAPTLEGDRVGPTVAANLGREFVEVRPPVEAPEDFPWQDLAVNIGLALREA